jgi:hypothetical protein
VQMAGGYRLAVRLASIRQTPRDRLTKLSTIEANRIGVPHNIKSRRPVEAAAITKPMKMRAKRIDVKVVALMSDPDRATRRSSRA